MNKQRYPRRFLVGLVAMWAGSPACVFAATFTVPLSPIVATAPDGDYLSAPFDFGTTFSHVESLTLEFAMPGGFEGNALTTGNSSYFRNLAFVLHDAAVPITNAWSISPESGIIRSAFNVPVTDPVSIGFGGLSFSFGGVTVEPTWPEFVLRGQGQLAFIDVFESSFHPLSEGIAVSSTTSWLPPTEITGASLTIVGTPVPEPNSALLLTISGAFCMTFRMRRGHRRCSRYSRRYCRLTTRRS